MESQASNRTEGELIAGILAGETQLYHELIRPHERSVYLLALSYVKNEADAEDVAQEAFVRAFRNLASFRAESKFSTWLISITLNEATSRLRRQSVILMESLDEPPDENRTISRAFLPDWRERPPEAVGGGGQEAHTATVEELPDLYRQVFLLRDVEELNSNETAKVLNLSIPIVKVRLHRARVMLQKRLAPQLKRTSPGSKKRSVPW